MKLVQILFTFCKFFLVLRWDNVFVLSTNYLPRNKQKIQKIHLNNVSRCAAAESLVPPESYFQLKKMIFVDGLI
jgi:hypothetical protein